MDSDKIVIEKLTRRCEFLCTLLIGLINQKHDNKVVVDRKKASSYSYKRSLHWNPSEESVELSILDKETPNGWEDSFKETMAIK